MYAPAPAILGLLKLRVLLAVAAALALPASASAARLGLAEVRGADGTLLAEAGDGAFAYPPDGFDLRIGSAVTTAGGVELRDVALAGGRIQVSRIFVPSHGTEGAAVDGLFVDGRERRAGLNALVPLGAGSYLITLQRAVVPGRGARGTGLVGLRLSVNDSSLGIPIGTELLVGLARAPEHRRTKRAAATWALLGLGALQSSAVTGPQVVPSSWLPANSIGVQAVAIAERFLGVPYVWGGATPFGFDCSGLTMYVYAQLGVQLPHFSGYQWTSGRHVSMSELQPGDLVFFHQGPSGPGHEGMYIGNGRFVHAPHTGDVVKISSLSDPGYAIGYVGAVRPY